MASPGEVIYLWVMRKICWDSSVLDCVLERWIDRYLFPDSHCAISVFAHVVRFAHSVVVRLPVQHKGVFGMIASDIMTRQVYTILSDVSAQEAAQLLSEKRISGIPVVDSEGNVIGMLTEADIISKVSREGLKVSDIMSCNVTSVAEDTPVDEIALLLTQRKIKRVPVMREGKLLGIVSRADIVHAVAQGHLIIRPW